MRLSLPCVSLAIAVFAGSATLAPAAIVINEIDYDSVGNDFTTPDPQEFVELYNPDSAPQSLAGMTLVFFNGAVSTNDAYITVPLTGSIPAGGYYTIGNRPGSTLPITDPIQNGAPDSFGIYTGTAPLNATNVNLVPGTGITYEGSNATTPIEFEIAAATFADGDIDSAPASLARIPNGTGPFVLTMFPTPLAVNSLVAAPEPASLAAVAMLGTLMRRRR